MTKYEKKIFEIVNASRDHLTAEAGVGGAA